eukprot:2322962-Prorocentrum_lima.AAC.1
MARRQKSARRRPSSKKGKPKRKVAPQSQVTASSTNTIVIHSAPVRRAVNKGKVAEARGFKDALLMASVMANSRPVAYPPLSAYAQPAPVAPAPEPVVVDEA